MDIKQLVARKKKLIDKKLDEILPSENTIPKKLHKAMRYSVFSGGKRIRPILAIESCLCCGGSVSDVLGAACAIELAHTFSLIHDDLPAMDDDNYRRGKLACHRKFDEATAILAGDGLLSLAFEILAMGKNPEVGTELIKELANSVGSLGMIGGQFVDIEREGKKKDSKTLDYINIHKTAFLIKAALKMGAQAAGADSKKIGAMERLGRFIGEAFQIVDDILDNGDSMRTLGKDGAYKKARFLTKKAKDILNNFGDKAGNLKAFSGYLVERRI